jgi:hypothetical protein
MTFLELWSPHIILVTWQSSQKNLEIIDEDPWLSDAIFTNNLAFLPLSIP